jgi:RecB family endonuclease NucS
MKAIALSKTATGWVFQFEADLEIFVGDRLDELFGLTRLAQQHTIDTEICDLIAIDPDHQPVILELKNVEDRYVVQQLTRYYHALVQAQPAFEPSINYEKPVRLIVIAPSFHRHNLIDQLYSRLRIEFWQFQILTEAHGASFQLTNLETHETHQTVIPPDAVVQAIATDPPPRPLINLLQKGDELSRIALLNVREQILNFDHRIQETTATGIVRYGRGKTKLCAEIRIYKATQKPFLYLYLPIPERGHLIKPSIVKGVGRMRLLSDDWQTVRLLAYELPGKSTASGLFNPSHFKALLDAESNDLSELEKFVSAALNVWVNRTYPST